MAMKRQILAVTVGIALTAAVLTPALSSNNQAFAQVTAESRVLQAILGLTDQIKQQTTEIKGKYDDTIFDLNIKKKFWEMENFAQAEAIAVDTEVLTAVAVGVFILDCGDVPEEACAFNVESIQIDGTDPTAIIVDANLTDFESVLGGTDISDKGITLPSNLLVDTGIGRIGASSNVLVTSVCEGFGSCESALAALEFNGEKPQGVKLGTVAISGSVSSATTGDISSQSLEIHCFDGHGNEIDCPFGK